MRCRLWRSILCVLFVMTISFVASSAQAAVECKSKCPDGTSCSYSGTIALCTCLGVKPRGQADCTGTARAQLPPDRDGDVSVPSSDLPDKTIDFGNQLSAVVLELFNNAISGNFIDANRFRDVQASLEKLAVSSPPAKPK